MVFIDRREAVEGLNLGGWVNVNTGKVTLRKDIARRRRGGEIRFALNQEISSNRSEYVRLPFANQARYILDRIKERKWEGIVLYECGVDIRDYENLPRYFVPAFDEMGSMDEPSREFFRKVDQFLEGKGFYDDDEDEEEYAEKNGGVYLHEKEILSQWCEEQGFGLKGEW